MCGIAGVIDSTFSNETMQAVVKQMTDIITHRGPDDEGFFIADGIGLGMRRLSIIDLAGGQQPIFNEDGSVVIVFNGEIYNYRDLRGQLEKRGHVFATNSDTEVIVHLYEEYGVDCVHHLRGMFGFAVWDTKRRRLLLARDRLGIKPLYYTHMGSRLVFGSEIKSLLQHHGIEARLNLEALSMYLSLRYAPAPHTLFEDIFALEPGHRLICDEGGSITVERYWDVSFTIRPDRNQSDDFYASELEELIKASVKMRLMSDVPFGAYLSGGIDSSTVVALMSQYLNEPVKTFSVGFKGVGEEEFSELNYANMVAQQYQTDHHEVLINAQDFMDLMEKVVWHLDQPISDPAVLANYMVARLAAQHVKMVLSGEGADEMFAGYARYVGERFSPVFRYVPGVAKSLALAASERLPGMRRPKIALYALCQNDEATRLTNWFPLFNQDRKSSLLTDSVHQALAGYSANSVFARHLATTDAKEQLNRMLYVDTKLWLPDDLLARGDKLSMAVSLEARVPFLDSKLVEFAASLPPHLKLRRLTRKFLLKRVSEQWLPQEITRRKKKGFPVPIPVWIQNEAHEFVRDILSPDTLRRHGLLNPDYVERLLTEHRSGFADHGLLIFGLLSLELWQRQYLENWPQPKPADSAAPVVVS
jgi:asparagine synthase (glutamine-hydrolysing)